MLRHGLGLHRRGPQAGDVLPSRIDNPTASLPSSIGPTDVATADPSATAPIVTAEAVSGFTTITEIQTLAKSTDTGETTFTTEVTKTITNSAEYASITSVAAAASSSSTTRTTTSTTPAAATSSAAAKQSNSNLSTLIPAIVVPLAVILLASLAVFWFFMRRRHRRELQSQPEFVMTGKGEKLNSRSSSSRSTTSNPGPSEKKSPVVFQNELPSAISPPTTTSEWPPTQVGGVRPQTPQGPGSAGHDRVLEQQRTLTANSPYRNFRGPGQGLPVHGPRPATAGRPGPPASGRDQGRNRNRSNSTPGQRGQPPPPRSGPSPVSRIAPSPVLRSGPSPVPLQTSPTHSPLPSSSAFRFRDPSPTMNLSNRAQAPSRLAAPPPGAFNGASSISQYSPIVKDTPTIPKVLAGKRAPPPINTADLRETTKSPGSNSPAGHGLTEENMRIARLANSSRLGHTPAEPSPSPKLPPPATRSQLIPRESPKEHQDRFFGGSGSSQSAGPKTAASSHYPSKRASVVSDADEYEDIDAKSDVSSLNEFERFDFGTGIGIGSGRGSPAGNSLTYFAATNSPASERGSAFGTTGVHERW
ncbi:hypothetical protein G647_03151 [Cladophialophora carrionii CBS 160.54]|uniref:Uncharacterized protein n=1 Tax=Cladophialophora carrionii CBS 160.54 TaxID=1279043 RepID=V9DHM1_9EURO|nr:uncharacterized protein G647_03151 [Cladophialophora carrionii CBS 160.54]ETI26374.1 hypothetical protein G647_03151 [Cladophialophora carrionii CBS 160.54]